MLQLAKRLDFHLSTDGCVIDERSGYLDYIANEIPVQVQGIVADRAHDNGFPHWIFHIDLRKVTKQVLECDFL